MADAWLGNVGFPAAKAVNVFVSDLEETGLVFTTVLVLQVFLAGVCGAILISCFQRRRHSSLGSVIKVRNSFRPWRPGGQNFFITKWDLTFSSYCLPNVDCEYECGRVWCP